MNPPLNLALRHQETPSSHGEASNYWEKCSSCVHRHREINIFDDLAPELSRRKRAAWKDFKSIEDVVKGTRNIRPRDQLFDSTVLPSVLPVLSVVPLAAE
uniref:MADF domain-containing protein n=1 Tax=Angiostrongylus cantonensis TaxID=6313 RepID=A0A0K0D4T8_ANGCA